VQKCLTLQHDYAPVRATKEMAGWSVPWEVTGYFDDYEKARVRGGLFDLSHWGFVAIEGPDAADYLHRMTTWDVKKAQSGTVYHGAFLTGRGNPIAMGFFERLDTEKFLLTFPPGQAAVAAEHAEKFHFAERLTVTDRSNEWGLFGLWNPEDSVCTELGFGKNADPMRIQSGIFRDDSRPSLFWVRIKRDDATSFFDRMRAQYVDLLGYRLFEYFRIEAAVPQVGVELGEKEIVLEGNFDRAVARDKGCYPGQEVVERIFTYGQVNKKLLSVKVETLSSFPELPIAIEGGSIVALAESPESQHHAVGLAYVNKQFWNSEQLKVAIPGVSVRLRHASAA
jgi:folate-binding protein YgfZ